MDVSDPLRFGAEIDEQETQEVPLDDGPSTQLHTARMPATAQPRSGADPLSSPALGVKEPRGYEDMYHGQQHERLETPDVQPRSQASDADCGLTGSHRVGASAGAADTANHHQQQQQHHRHSPLNNLDIEPEDASYSRGAAGEGSAGPSSARAAPALQISVTDPVQRVGDSVIPGFTSTHTEYLVTTVFEVPNRRVQVRRRFRDFVALSDLLATTQRGYFVFPRPDKNTLDQQLGKSDFVEIRRLELERYLRKLAVHPVVRHSEELKVFLEAEGSLGSNFSWQQLQPVRGTLMEGISRLPRQLLGSDSSVPSTFEAQQNARNTSDLLRRFRELGERMRQEYKTGAPPALDAAEIKLREERASVEEYAERLASASKRAECMVKEFEEMGAVMGDVGLSLVKLAKFEDEEGSKCGQYSDLGVGARAVAADARRVGLAAVRQSRLARLANGQVMEVLEPLHNELAMSPAVVGALREREAALLTVQSIKDDLERRQAAVAALEESGSRRVGGNAAKARKVAAMQNDVSALESALVAAEQEYERVKERNIEELERTKRERMHDFKQLVADLGRAHAAFEDRRQEIWRDVADNFGALARLDTQ